MFAPGERGTLLTSTSPTAHPRSTRTRRYLSRTVDDGGLLVVYLYPAPSPAALCSDLPRGNRSTARPPKSIAVTSASMQSCTDSGCSSNAPPSASTKDAAFAGEGYGGGDVRPAGSLGGRGVGKGIGEGWVQVISVTSDNDQFHLASFQTQALPPDGETSFKVRCQNFLAHCFREIFSEILR